jgi:predicted component of viral defense system (DUF524 family)
MRIADTRIEHTTDVYENRLVKAFWDQVARQLLRLRNVVAEGAHGNLLADIDELRRELNRARRQAPFLDHVSNLEHAPTQVTMILARRPAYRAALEGLLALHKRAIVRLDEPAFDAPLENLPHLYQIWGTLQVLLALQVVAAAKGYRLKEHRLVRRSVGEFFVRVLPDNKPALTLAHPITGAIVNLIPERRYPSAQQASLHSVSYTQRPDISVELQVPDQPTRVYLFDPKYKLWSEALTAPGGGKIVDLGSNTGYEEVLPFDEHEASGRPTKVDIDKMHTYRDSIRDQEGSRVVEYAAILYPGPTESFSPSSGIEALQAQPLQSAPLQEHLQQLFTAFL